MMMMINIARSLMVGDRPEPIIPLNLPIILF